VRSSLLHSRLNRIQYVRTPSDIVRTVPGFSLGFCGKSDTPPAYKSVKQVHGTEIASDELPQGTPADAIYTQKTGVTVGVQTADCLPILVCCPGRIAMAVHAGWRGLTSGIVLKAVKLVRDLGDLRSAQFFLGPAISEAQFEVGSDVIDAASRSGLSEIDLSLSMSKGRGDRWHFNLRQAAVSQLLAADVAPEAIAVVLSCTVQEVETWHSYRRDGPRSGRNISWIRRES